MIASILAFFSTPVGMAVLIALGWGIRHKFGVPDILNLFGKKVDPKVDLMLEILRDIQNLLTNDPTKDDKQEQIDELKALVDHVNQTLAAIRDGTPKSP